jgi:hypothetical protein
MVMIFPAARVFASGAREDRMAEVESLVDQREYNMALNLLTEVLKDDPDKIYDVQELLIRIRTEKEYYNDRYEELIETYGGDDVEAAYPLIKELEELDPNPNEATRISLVLARETAGFVFNNNRWVDIMEKGRELLDAGEYAAAAENYMAGFDLSRDIFKDAGYGNIVVNDIFREADQMEALTREFIALYPEIAAQFEKINKSFNDRNIGDYIIDVDAVYPGLLRAAEIREALKDTADYFIVQENGIRTGSGNDGQVHYLIYMDRLLNGRTTVDELEGITGAIEIFWNLLYKQIASDSVVFAEELFNTAYEQYKNGNYETSINSFGDVTISAESSLVALNFGVGFLESDSEFARKGLLSMNKEIIDNDIIYSQQQYDTAQSFVTIIEKQNTILDFNNRIVRLEQLPDNAGEEGRLIREEITAENTELDSLLTVWQSRVTSLGSGDSVKRSIEIAEIPVDEYSKQLAELLQSEIKLTAMLAEIDLNVLEADYLAAETAVNTSSELIKGITAQAGSTAAEVPGDEFEVRYKYPDQALKQLLETERTVTALVSGIDALGQRIDGERTPVKNGAEVRAASAHVSELAEKSRVILAQAKTLGDSAREQIFTAEKLKQEGERRIEDSKRFMQQARFAEAKDRLEQAAAKFDESLSYLEDTVLRTYRDNEIPRLYDEIQVAENNLVVKQVREYLTAGKSNYSQGNFPTAQSVLIKAQSRWSDTNVEPNPEVEYWLTLTQTALSVTSGRNISKTDPLYAEMNQYMNQAYSDYQQARSEYDKGRKTEADNYFSRAEQSILVVQQFFPFNEEARVLNLRISQYRNPEQFNEVFRKDFQTAQKLITSNPQKAYIDLKDLETINASYPGLKTAITEAEYAAGIKVRPPDTAKLKRSTELYQLAYNIVSRNVRSEFSVALSYLDEAISLNPNNNDAIRLKDRIATDLGGTAVVVMTNTDQQKYDEAVIEFTAGNYLKARILVENLLKNPVNQRNPKILDLKERIERTR